MPTLFRTFYQPMRMAIRRLSSEIGSKEYFDNIVNSNKVVVFMKGTSKQPQCGFSNAVVQILNFHEVPFKDVNVLEDDKLRQGIKEYSQWPTIPQIYVNKEFIGGCDILIQMHKDGELIKTLANVGIKSAQAKE